MKGKISITVWRTMLLFVAIVFAFYWWQVRPVGIRSQCDKLSLMKSKAETLSLHETYTSSAGDVSYTTFLKNKYDHDKGFRDATFDEESYKFYYSQCLHSRGMQ